MLGIPIMHMDSGLWQDFCELSRATRPVLTSNKEQKDVTSPRTLNLTVRRGKLGIYTLQNMLEVFWKLAPLGVNKEGAVVCFA